jgi:uncharacterized protein YeaO (DUF488 family)
MIRVERVYQNPGGEEDGLRFLVERLWPRGMKKEALKMNAWLKDVAPSADLRTWFAHDPARWDEFRQRYFAELDANPGSWQPLIQAAQSADITLLYSARDTEHNNAEALKQYLEARLRK